MIRSRGGGESGCYTLTDSVVESTRAPELDKFPLVAISVLNWNGWQDTLKCLTSVRQLDYPNYLTVLVDNGSADDSVERIRAWAKETLPDPGGFAEYSAEAALDGGLSAQEAVLRALTSKDRLVLIRNRENLGFTGGNNTAIQYALARWQPAEFVFLLNNDASVSEGSLGALVASMGKANTGIAEATVFASNGQGSDPPFLPPRWYMTLDRVFGGEPGTFIAEDNLQEVFSARGAAMMIRSGLLRTIFSANREYLHDRFFMYMEDAGISIRARKLGYRCVRANDAVVWHKGSSSAGGKYNSIEYYYTVRNGLLISKELSAGGKAFVYLHDQPKNLARVVKNLLYRRYSAAHAILCGMIDGYRGLGGKWCRHDLEVKRRKESQ